MFGRWTRRRLGASRRNLLVSTFGFFGQSFVAGVGACLSSSASNPAGVPSHESRPSITASSAAGSGQASSACSWAPAWFSA